jgi:hypothetical protein
MLSPVVMKLLTEARMNELRREAKRARLAREARSGRRWSTFPLAALGLLLAAIGLVGRVS